MIEFKLKRLVAYKEMTQAELAEKTGIRLPTISNIYNNKVKHLSVDAIDKICNVLDCEPSDWIIFKKDEE